METIIIIGGDMNKFIAFYVVGTTIRTHFPFCLFLYFHPKKKNCRDFFFVIMAHYYFFSIENWEIGGHMIKNISIFMCCSKKTKIVSACFFHICIAFHCFL